MKNVYLAYAPQDTARAKEVRQILQAQGYRPWLDPQPKRETAWHPGTESAIQAADALVLLLTQSAAASLDLTYAWAFALGAGLPVFVIVFEEAPEHPRLQLAHRHDLADYSDENHFWDSFLADFAQRLADEHRVAAPPSDQAEIDRSVMPDEPGYWLVMRRGPLPNQLYRLERKVVNIGRDLANDIVIRDAQVSRFHLRLALNDGDYALQDLGSSNGTRLNGVKLGEPARLNEGDFIAIGDSILLTYELVYEE